MVSLPAADVPLGSGLLSSLISTLSSSGALETAVDGAGVPANVASARAAAVAAATLAVRAEAAGAAANGDPAAVDAELRSIVDDVVSVLSISSSEVGSDTEDERSRESDGSIDVPVAWESMPGSGAEGRGGGAAAAKGAQAAAATTSKRSS
jgi:hypothetical protein